MEKDKWASNILRLFEYDSLGVFGILGHLVNAVAFFTKEMCYERKKWKVVAGYCDMCSLYCFGGTLCLRILGCLHYFELRNARLRRLFASFFQIWTAKVP